VTEIAVYNAARRVAVYSEATRTGTRSYGGNDEGILDVAEVVVYGQAGNIWCVVSVSLTIDIYTTDLTTDSFS